MPKASILLPATALIAVLGLAGCHPHDRAATALPIDDAPAADAQTSGTVVQEPAKPPHGCFVKVREADQVTHTKERVLVAPAASTDKVIPAVTRVVDKTVVVTPAWTQTITTPAVYKTVWHTETTAGRSYAISSPARYRMVSERVLIAPARTVWKAAHGRFATGPAAPGYAAYAPTGEVMCAVRIPARYIVRTRRELVSSGERRVVQGRDMSRRVSERVLVQPAGSRVVEHPAVTKIVQAVEVVTPEHVVAVRTPPVWTLVDRTVRTPRYGWKPVPCAKPHRTPAVKPHRAAPRPHVVHELPYALPLAHGAPYGERG